MTRILMFALLGAAAAIPAGAQANQPALEGLDPVLLTEGQETPGKDTIAYKHGRFLYQFSTEETRARFQKEPERYGIQLDGACARMGAPVEGSGDAYFVHNHRIYVFGSSDCYKRFSANPRKYLEEEQPKPDWSPTDETRQRGKALLDKTVAVMGGREKFDGVKSYAETRQVQSPRGAVIERIYAKLPDSLMSETTAGDNSFGTLATPHEVLTFFHGNGHHLPASFGSAILANSQRELLPLLLKQNATGFESYYAGRSGNAERLQISNQGRVSTVLVDMESGKVMAIEWQGRSPAGYVRYHAAYSDYRPVSGLLLPFRAEITAEGSDEPLPTGRSWTVVSYDVNPAEIEAKLRPKLKIDEQ